MTSYDLAYGWLSDGGFNPRIDTAEEATVAALLAVAEALHELAPRPLHHDALNPRAESL